MSTKAFTKNVVHGNKQGRHIGFPTLNFDPSNVTLEYGVYLCKIFIENTPYFGALHFGPKKSFEGDISLEIHVFDFQSDIYGEEVSVEVLQKIRDIKKFNGIDELVNQIQLDVKVCKSLINNNL